MEENILAPLLCVHIVAEEVTDGNFLTLWLPASNENQAFIWSQGYQPSLN